MSEIDDLRAENASLREHARGLTERLAAAEARIAALVRSTSSDLEDQAGNTDLLEASRASLRRSEQALRESELRYQRLIEDLPEVVVVQVDQKVVFANAAAARAFGLPTQDALNGRSILDFATPETRARIEARRKLPLREGEHHALVEHTFVDAMKGREIRLEVKSIAVTYRGKPAVLSIARDVTDRAQAQIDRERRITALEFERNRLGTLLAKAPAFMAVFRGKNHVYEMVNEAHRALIGEREVLGKPVLEAIPEAKGQDFIHLLDRVLATGEPYVGKRVPVTLVRKPGAAPEVRYVDFVYQAIFEPDGTTSGLLSHGVDVTDVTVAEQRLRAQFHGVPVPTYVWQRVERDGTKQFVLVDYNKAALTISHGKISEQLGKPSTSVLDDDPSLIADIEKCLADEKIIQREVTRTLKSTGETKWLFVTYACAPPDLVVVHTEDITARATLEHQFRQAQKLDAVGRLAGGVAHDFNNLLSVIMTYTHLALEEVAPSALVRGDLRQIVDAAERASELTKQLLAFSRQQVLEPRVLDLNESVRGMERLLSRLLGEDIELIVRPADGLGRVVADPGQVEQIIMNLAVNARDAMPRGGRLTIETSNVAVDSRYVRDHSGVAPGRYVVLAVSDTGSGMSPATVARIFEPFFTTKEPGKGTGLGLATVFGITQQSGGHVGVESTEGRGTTFKVYLPPTDRPLDLPVDEVTAALVRGSETILLVEDSVQVRTVACTILRRNGYQVLDASDGAEALRVARGLASRIDLLLTDVVMPNMSGRELVEELQPLRPDMKVLYASGYTDDAVVQHGVNEAGAAFLQKPFTPQTLLRKVRAVLDGAPPSRRGLVTR